MIDQEKIAKFIAELRKDKGLTQNELGIIAHVGREGVSKWERGVTVPSHASLLELSKIFDVTVNEILYGERITKTNEKEVEAAPYKLIDKISDRFKRFKKLFIIIIVLLIIIYLVSYFIFQYTSFKIYATYINADDLTIKQGLIVKSYNYLYFNFGNVINYYDEDIKDMYLYYGDKDNRDRTKLWNGSTLETAVLRIKDYEALANKSTKDIVSNLYLEVNTETETKDYKINVKLNFKSMFKINTEDKKSLEEVEDNNIEAYSETSGEFERIKKKFKLKDGNYYYEAKYKNKKYNFWLQEDTIQLIEKDYILRYKIGSDVVNILSRNNKLEFNINTRKCESGDCKPYMDGINALINKVLK